MPTPEFVLLAVFFVVALILIERRLKTMDDATNRLTTEVQETKDAFEALKGRVAAQAAAMQEQIDALKAAAANGDQDAINAAADALDALQTEIAATAQPAAPVDTTTGAAGDDPLPASDA